MAVERTLIEHYAPSSDFARFLQGRYVTEIDDEFDTITLDNGTTLEIEGNEGCAWCRSGWYELINVFKQGTSSARIMSAHVACDIDEESDDESEDRAVDPHVYTLFVMVDGNSGFLPLATIRGDDGGGGYGTGFRIFANVVTSPPSATRQDLANATAGGHYPLTDTTGDVLTFVARILHDTHGANVPVRICGDAATRFHVDLLDMRDEGDKEIGLPYRHTFHHLENGLTLLWHKDADDSFTFVLRDLRAHPGGLDVYARNLSAFLNAIHKRTQHTEVVRFVASSASRANYLTVDGERIPSCGFLLSELDGTYMYAEQERSDQLDKPSQYVMNQKTGREMRYTTNLRTIKPLPTVRASSSLQAPQRTCGRSSGCSYGEQSAHERKPSSWRSSTRTRASRDTQPKKAWAVCPSSPAWTRPRHSTSTWKKPPTTSTTTATVAKETCSETHSWTLWAPCGTT